MNKFQANKPELKSLIFFGNILYNSVAYKLTIFLMYYIYIYVILSSYGSYINEILNLNLTILHNLFRYKDLFVYMFWTYNIVDELDVTDFSVVSFILSIVLFVDWFGCLHSSSSIWLLSYIIAY